MKRKQAKLILSDGSEFCGWSFGFDGESAGEVVFSTAMTGYPESLTDPSHVKALFVADYSEQYSRWNAKESLASWLRREHVPAITGIDTRRLTKVLKHIFDIDQQLKENALLSE